MAGIRRSPFIYRGTQFPSQYQGSYFFADYAQNWVERLTLDANGNVTGVFNFEPPNGSPDGPYGDIVYLCEVRTGLLLRRPRLLGHHRRGRGARSGGSGSSVPPTCRRSRSPAPSPPKGPPPLVVTFSSLGTSDPEGLP